MTGRAASNGRGLPRTFWRLWTGESVAAFGTYVTLLALQVLVLITLGGDATDVGLLNSARWLPYLVLGLFVGALVDRRRRQPVMIATDVGCALLLGLIPLAWALDVLSVPMLLVIVVAYGAVALVNDAASMSFLPRLLSPAQLQPAYARLDTSSAVAQTAGPALAGVLIKVIGAPLAVLVDAATYLFCAAMVATVRAAEPRPDRRRLTRADLRRDIAEGVRWIYRGDGLRTLAIGTHIWFAANAILGVVVPTFALLSLGLTVPQLGVATALGGAGAVLGAVLTGALGRAVGTGRAIITAHLISVAGVAVMASAGLGGGWVAALVLGAGQALHGLAMGLSNSHEMSYRLIVTPEHVHARVTTTMRAVNRAVIVLVAPLAGLLAAGIGTRAALLVAGAVFAVAVAVLIASPFRSVDVTSRSEPLDPR